MLMAIMLAYQTSGITSSKKFVATSKWWPFWQFWNIKHSFNLTLITATGLVILLKMDSNRRFFSPCNLEIWWMTSKYNMAPHLYYIKLCASFQINLWIQTRVIVRKRSILVKIGNFLFRVTLKFNGWPWKTIRHLFYPAVSFVHHFKP